MCAELGDHVNDQQLLAARGPLWPRIFAYVLSFAVIGRYWLAHWRRFHYIERVAEPLILLNLLLLGLIAFIPFPTALVGQYGDRPFVVVLYALTLAAAGLSRGSTRAGGVFSRTILQRATSGS